MTKESDGRELEIWKRILRQAFVTRLCTSLMKLYLLVMSVAAVGRDRFYQIFEFAELFWPKEHLKTLHTFFGSERSFRRGLRRELHGRR